MITAFQQSKEVHSLAATAAGERGIQAEHFDGGVTVERLASPHSHPAPPGGHGPPSAPRAAGAS